MSCGCRNLTRTTWKVMKSDEWRTFSVHSRTESRDLPWRKVAAGLHSGRVSVQRWNCDYTDGCRAADLVRREQERALQKNLRKKG